MRLAFKAAAGAALVITLTSGWLFAAPARVRLLRPANGGALIRELTARTAGEVVAAGFSVELQDLPLHLAPGGRLDASDIDDGRQDGGAAVSISITSPSGGDDDALIAIRVGRDAVYQATVTRDPATGNASDDSRSLTAAAVRAMAALQTALLARQPRTSSNAPLPATISAPPRELDARPPKRIGIDLGISMLQSLQGVGVAFVPTARVSYRLSSRAMVGLRTMAFGTPVTATALAGDARIRQDLALLETSIAFRPKARLHPLAMGGAGVYHMSVTGTGSSPFVGQGATFWGAVVDVGVGLSFDLSARVALDLESHAVWVTPQPSVRIDTAEIGRAGRPSLSQTAGLRLWF